MFRFEESRQQAIHLQQPRSGQLNSIPLDVQHSLFRIILPFVFPLLQDFDLELVSEVASIKSAMFQLQDHFPYQHLMWCRAERSRKRQLS